MNQGGNWFPSAASLVSIRVHSWLLRAFRLRFACGLPTMIDTENVAYIFDATDPGVAADDGHRFHLRAAVGQRVEGHFVATGYRAGAVWIGGAGTGFAGAVRLGFCSSHGNAHRDSTYLWAF